MFFDDNNSEVIDRLVSEAKRYIDLQKEYTRLEIVEKLTVIISALAVVFIGLVLGLMTLCYLLFSLAYVLEPHVGGLSVSYAIIAGISLVILVTVALLRKQLFVKPLISFLTNLFFNDSKRK